MLTYTAHIKDTARNKWCNYSWNDINHVTFIMSAFAYMLLDDTHTMFVFGIMNTQDYLFYPILCFDIWT